MILPPAAMSTSRATLSPRTPRRRPIYRRPMCRRPMCRLVCRRGRPIRRYRSRVPRCRRRPKDSPLKDILTRISDAGGLTLAGNLSTSRCSSNSARRYHRNNSGHRYHRWCRRTTIHHRTRSRRSSRSRNSRRRPRRNLGHRCRCRICRRHRHLSNSGRHRRLRGQYRRSRLASRSRARYRVPPRRTSTSACRRLAPSRRCRTT